MTETQKFLFADDIVKLLNISRASAYRLIKKLNSELSEQGFFTIAGRVPRKYFEEKFYC